MAKPKGRPNKATKALREMILGALEANGGEEWLIAQMDKQPAAKALLGRLRSVKNTQV